MGKEVRITTNADYYEEHADNLELWSPGNPLFDRGELLTATDEPIGAKTLAEVLDY